MSPTDLEERCGACGVRLGSEADAWIWKGGVVCASCHKALAVVASAAVKGRAPSSWLLISCGAFLGALVVLAVLGLRAQVSRQTVSTSAPATAPPSPATKEVQGAPSADLQLTLVEMTSTARGIPISSKGLMVTNRSSYPVTVSKVLVNGEFACAAATREIDAPSDDGILIEEPGNKPARLTIGESKYYKLNIDYVIPNYGDAGAVFTESIKQLHGATNYSKEVVSVEIVTDAGIQEFRTKE